MARRQDDMDPKETFNLFIVADQDKSGKLDKVELADLLRLVRLSAIKSATDHIKAIFSLSAHFWGHAKRLATGLLSRAI
ncbi:unnamed protein product [Gongylonema pulchrum]|uniref:EF-hand domain-containing protein n=1 Tax=Gongylonema pulchrum TaxID=637853 RepID=A0A183EPU3_9BILA|nr:unnamed protein product [Gongylonema pulchrum]